MPNTQPKPKDGAATRPGFFRRVRERLMNPRPGCGYLSAMIGGLAGTLAFQPLNLFWLAPLAPFFAFDALRRASGPGAAFRRMLVFGWIFYFGAIQWITSIGHYAPVPILASFGIALLALYIAMYLALAVYILRRWCWAQGPGIQFLLFASAWLLAEWLRTLGRLAVPLAQLGHAWATWPLMIQPAQFTGELGVSAEILWLAGILYYWYLYAKTARSKGTTESSRARDPRLPSIGRGVLPTLFFPVLVLASLLLMTMWKVRLDNFAKKKEAQSLRVALLQANIRQEIKLASYGSPYSDVRDLLRNAIETIGQAMLAGLPRPDWEPMMLRLTAPPPPDRIDDAFKQAYYGLNKEIEALRPRIQAEGKPLGADLALLPETAFSEDDFAKNPAALDRAAAMARLAAAPILLGAGRTEGEGKDWKIFNSAYLIQADGSLAPQVYDKMRLVPFGESLPYFDMIPGFQEGVVGIGGTFTEGKDWTLFEAKGRTADGAPGGKPLRIGTLICFESTFSASARALTRSGADILAVITNDGWYGLSAGAAAHRDLSYLRAVETRRYVLRCANTGISTVISPLGEEIAALPLGSAGLLRATVVPKTDYGMTMFARFGNAWLAIPAGLLALSFAAARRRSRAQQS